MKIITYTADADEDVPTSAQSVAYIHLGSDGFLPVVFRGETSRAARAKAQSHWDAEIEKVRQAARNREAMSARRRKPATEAQPEPVIEEAF